MPFHQDKSALKNLMPSNKFHNVAFDQKVPNYSCWNVNVIHFCLLSRFLFIPRSNGVSPHLYSMTVQCPVTEFILSKYLPCFKYSQIHNVYGYLCVLFRHSHWTRKQEEIQWIDNQNQENPIKSRSLPHSFPNMSHIF